MYLKTEVGMVCTFSVILIHELRQSNSVLQPDAEYSRESLEQDVLPSFQGAERPWKTWIVLLPPSAQILILQIKLEYIISEMMAYCCSELNSALKDVPGRPNSVPKSSSYLHHALFNKLLLC